MNCNTARDRVEYCDRNTNTNTKENMKRNIRIKIKKIKKRTKITIKTENIKGRGRGAVSEKTQDEGQEYHKLQKKGLSVKSIQIGSNHR